jgi:hypothetical protein
LYVVRLIGYYSLLKLLTGLANAALIDWKLMVAKAIRVAPSPAAMSIHQDIPTL